MQPAKIWIDDNGHACLDTGGFDLAGMFGILAALSQEDAATLVCMVGAVSSLLEDAGFNPIPRSKVQRMIKLNADKFYNND